MDDDINANTYRSKIIDRQRGYRSRESEVVMGSLIDDGDLRDLRWTKLAPAAGTLTGRRSLISEAETEVETSKLWAVCSITISQYIKMRRVKKGKAEHSH